MTARHARTKPKTTPAPWRIALTYGCFHAAVPILVSSSGFPVSYLPTSEPIEALIFSSEVDLNFESLGIIEQFGEKFC